MSHHYVITGCSGGGKSTLLTALADAGFATVAEPGRQVVAEELASGGTALPWIDEAAFAAKAIARGVAGLTAADPGAVTFFDRSPIDNVTALARAGLPVPDLPPLAIAKTVFVAPPWPEIYVTDAERRHTFDDALAEYETLLPAYRARGHTLSFLPKSSVAERVAFVRAALA